MITIAQIYAAMSDDTCAYGLRVCRWLVWSGETLAPSAVWIDGNYTDELLPGTCCIALGDIDHRPSLAEIAKAVRLASKYRGACVAVIKSRHVASPDIERNDPGEEILIDPTVVLSVHGDI